MKQTKKQVIQRVLTSGEAKHRKSKSLLGSGSWITRENQESLLAIGDKHGNDISSTISLYGAGVDVIEEFSEFIGLPVKLIHTIRNPYDIIPAWIDRQKAIRHYPDIDERFDKLGVRVCVDFYNVMQSILDKHHHFNLYNDELIRSPSETLVKLCDYLELPVVEPWFATAVRSVYTEPHNRKDNREWFPGQKQRIETEVIDKYPYFSLYREPL
jgi:hypothetical protein